MKNRGLAERDKILRAKLKKARIEANLEQVYVASLLGRPQSYISKLETGVKKIDILELIDLANIYQKDVHFFLKSIVIQEERDKSN